MMVVEITRRSPPEGPTRQILSMNDGASATLRDFIDNRWAAVRRNNARFRDCYELRHRLADVSSREAAWFLEAIALHGDEPPLYRVQDDNKHPSRRIPPNAGGGPRGNVFFEKPGPYGSLRLETIVHQAAAWRLHDEVCASRGSLPSLGSAGAAIGAATPTWRGRWSCCDTSIAKG
jgi:hypothetical protein